MARLAVRAPRGPRSLVARLAVAAGLLAGLSTVLGVVVVERSATDRLVGDLDADLLTQQREWQALADRHPPTTTADLARLGRRWLAEQHEHPLSQLQLLRVGGLPVASNQPELAARACAAGARPARGTVPWLVQAPPGITTAYLDSGEAVRVLTLPVAAGPQPAPGTPPPPAGSEAPGGVSGVSASGVRTPTRVAEGAAPAALGTLQVADSLAPVRAARERWRQESLVLGAPLALGTGLAVALAAWLLLRPLRTVGEVAGRVGDGDLGARIGRRAGRSSELARVGRVLDGMLDRVQETVARERRFVADASHEMRTPLAVLRVAAERLGTRVPAEQRGEAEALVARIDRLGRLVEDLLTLAVTDAGSRTLLPREVRVADLAADLERDLPLHGERRFVVRACGGGVRLDPERFEQVLRNLVANAVRHTRPGGRIEVAFAPHPQQPGRLVVTVSDDGEGIAPDLLPHVFERFRSEPGPDGRGRRGAAGLGLPICRALVEAHGGTIALRSTPGVGTTAIIDLPGHTLPESA